MQMWGSSALVHVSVSIWNRRGKLILPQRVVSNRFSFHSTIPFSHSVHWNSELMWTLQMRLGCLLLAKLACAESGFDEGITLQQGEWEFCFWLEPSQTGFIGTQQFEWNEQNRICCGHGINVHIMNLSQSLVIYGFKMSSIELHSVLEVRHTQNWALIQRSCLFFLFTLLDHQ